MKYKTSDIIRKSRQLADLVNSDFLTWDEQIGLVNDSYITLYQKLVNLNDGSFARTLRTVPGETVLPPDFWQLRSVSIWNNGNVTPIKRRASSESMNCTSYEIKFDKIFIYGTPSVGDIVIEYWSKPATLTFKPKEVVMAPPTYSDYTIVGVHDNSFWFKYIGETTTTFLVWDAKTETEKNYEIGGSVDEVIFGKDKAILVLNDESKKSLTYLNGMVQNFTGIPFIMENGTVGTITDGKCFINRMYVADFDWKNVPSVVVCSDELDDFWGIVDGTLYHNDEQFLFNETDIEASQILFKNGNCWYWSSVEIGYVDSEENIHIVDTIAGIIGINKIDEDTGYGYTVTNGDGTFTVFPWVEDTVLDFPNSFYFQILAYMLAVQYKIKQNADATGLLSTLASQEQTFYDTLAQDANEPVRIRNVY